MQTRYEDDFITRLQALEVASERVKEHWLAGEDSVRLAVIDMANGLHAVYDLEEAFFRALGIRQLRLRDDFLASNEGELVGALSCARGARTHQLVALAGPAGFGQVPYGQGPFGGGMVWADHEWKSERYARRSGWYAEHVRMRALWQPLDEAWHWFLERMPKT